MAGETQRMHAIKELDAETKQEDEGTALEQQSDKTTRESSEHFSSTGAEAKLSAGATSKRLVKERDCSQQREAVIRPQQAGKIDFKLLQNRSKFATDRTWSSGKGSPQSPSGKGRSRERGKRPGKAERSNSQQLDRLSVTNPRTVGIAYPQQKVLPPKKLESNRSPVSGTLRFYVSSGPERQVELQQEELNYSRCFQETPPNCTSPGFTSQALGPSSRASSNHHLSLSQQQQQAASMEGNGVQPSNQLILTDFQMNGTNTWQSHERTFTSAGYGHPSQKSSAHSEANKTTAFVPGPFQYGYHLTEETTSGTFPCEQNPPSQGFSNSSSSSGHANLNSFAFAPSDGQTVAHSGAQFNSEIPENRTLFPHPPQSQFMQGMSFSTQCPRNLSEDSASSDSSGSQQSEQGKALPPESREAIVAADSQDAAITSGSERNCHPKDTAASQRTLAEGGAHSGNISQSPGSPMHFPNRTFSNPPVSNICAGPIAFDKNNHDKVLNRLTPHSWEGVNKQFFSADQNSPQFAEMNEKFPFQNLPLMEQRSNMVKNSRMPWQQIRLPSSVPNSNRIELARQVSNQKLTYIVSPSDWQDESKSHKSSSVKNASSYQSGRGGEGYASQRQDSVKYNNSNNACSTFKIEMGHAQVCESKNKTVYFGLNQSIPRAPMRNYNYPQLQVPPMGLMMVSPYESPLPSPVQNPSSSSTCSSLSPASTSPVNISSEDSLLSKPAPAHSFYHHPQTKTQLHSDHLSSQPQPSYSDTLSYAPERTKVDAISYQQHGALQKTCADGSKSYMDSFGMDHHQPPPPYSAHQLLASSLATANLDQLDVLLTCKQCDQNFSNLASFLGHKQYCAQHTFAHNDLKEMSKAEETKKFHPEPFKPISVTSNVSLAPCPSDLHLSLLGLNKNGELMSDSEIKGDSKDDPLKISLYSGSGNLPVPLPDLEMEDPKLDSLITEALNGLGYQSDNAEIDSSFIDAFVDDEPTSVKTFSNKQCVKAKESLVYESTNKHAADDQSTKFFSGSGVASRKKLSVKVERGETTNIKKDTSNKNPRPAPRDKMWEQEHNAKESKKQSKGEEETANARFFLSSKFSEHCGVKSFQENAPLPATGPPQASTSPTSRAAAKESKRKSSCGGTWSKELIQKIVQQKNKLHKLHVKGTKNLQFSLVMERLTPAMQNPAFGKYDYVSDSDNECEPVKIASQGRLNQSSRCKYTYTKECKWRARSERDQAAWRHESKECFEMKKSQEMSLSPDKPGSQQRARKRGSKLSTSSELSTSVSISSDGSYSPKSTEITDSDCEKRPDKKKVSLKNSTHDRSSSQKVFKESSTLALTFTKSVKYNSDKDKDLDKNSVEDQRRCLPAPADMRLSFQKAVYPLNTFEGNGHTHTNNSRKPAHELDVVYSDKNPSQKTHKLSSKETFVPCSNANDITLQSNSISKETVGDMNRKANRCRDESPLTAPADLGAAMATDKQSSVVKEATPPANDQHIHKPESLCQSLMDEVCLSPPESENPLIQKDALHLMPYSLDHEQGLMKSPLSFDTSSMFGDLAGFDSGLYSDMPHPKEGFHSMQTPGDKKEEFESPFSNFLEQRDWNLIVNPVLSDEMSPISSYKENSEKSNVKKQDYCALSLSEKIIDYNGSHGALEDELEIKRIVNELENQLQTTKLESPSLLVKDVPKQLQMSKFSPLRLGDECEGGGSMKCPEQQAMDAPAAKMTSEVFSEPSLPWTSPFQFELMVDHHSPATPIQTESELKIPEAYPKLRVEKKKDEKVAVLETKEELLEQRRYTENLMKSLEVISGSIFKKDPVASAHEEPNASSLTSQQCEETECQATDATERDRSEKGAITATEKISSHPNISERKGEIEFICDDSQPPSSNNSDPSVCGGAPISPQPSEATAKVDDKTEAGITLGEDVTLNSLLTSSTHLSSSVSDDTHTAGELHSNTGGDTNQNWKSKEYSLTDGCKRSEAAEVMSQQSEARPSSPAGADLTPDPANTLEQQSADDKPKEVSSALTGKVISHSSCCAVEEITAEMSKLDHLTASPSDTGSPSNTFTEAAVSVQKSAVETPRGPISMQVNTNSCCSPFRDIHSAEGQSNLSALSQSDGIINEKPRQITPFNDSLKTESSLIFEAQKQEEMLNVHVIKEDLPLDFMASQQNSPCKGNAEESHCMLTDAACPVGPALSPAHTQTVCKLVPEEDLCAAKSRKSQFVDQSSCQSETVPTESEQDNRGDVNRGEISALARIDFSLLSRPQLDSRLLDCDMHSSETAPEKSFTSSLEKTNPMYSLHTSPLNYNCVSDDPPELKQYGYMSVTPSPQHEHNPDNKIICTDQPVGSSNSTQTVTINLDHSMSEPVGFQQEVKSTCTPGHIPSETQIADIAAESVATNLQDFHNIEQMHMYADDLSGAEKRESRFLEATTTHSSPLASRFPDAPPDPKPLILCENLQSSSTSDSSQKLPQAETTALCSGAYQTHEEKAQSKVQSNSQQGKVQCDICLMGFRTVPGLKRHKAMKHLVRAGKHVGPQNTTPSQRGDALIYEVSQTSQQNQRVSSSHALFPTKIDELSRCFTSKTAESEGDMKETGRLEKTGFQKPPVQAKGKKTNKVRKNKNTDLTSDSFSDELLNILKTDILQAIAPEFKCSAVQECSKSSLIKINDSAGAGSEESSGCVTSDPTPLDKQQFTARMPNVVSSSEGLNEIPDAAAAECNSGTKPQVDMCTGDEIESLPLEKESGEEHEGSQKTLHHVEREEREVKASEENLAEEPLGNVSTEVKSVGNESPSDNLHSFSCPIHSLVSPPNIAPDLTALFDDDTSFSQLFPRDDEAKRKKCQRVYSKRNKRQKLSPPTDAGPDYTPPENVLQSKVGESTGEAAARNQPNHCEQESISTDESNVLGSLMAETSHQGEANNECEMSVPVPAERTPADWAKSDDSISCSAVTSELDLCSTEAPATPNTTAACSSESNTTEGAQTLHSIDIQNINTTFQLPEIQFFDSEKDITVAPPLEMEELESRSDERSKKAAERRCKKKQDPVIKVKDKQYKCKVCFTWFLTLGELNFHKLSHNPSPPPTCYMCVQRKFSSREQLRDHLREKHAKNKTGIWTCGMCLKEISDVWMYNEHLREHATQFARKGQTQGSILGIPGSIMQETAVKNFISSIMQHRPSKGSRESMKAAKEQQQQQQQRTAVEDTGDAKTSEGAETKLQKTKSTSGKGNSLTPLEVVHKTEVPKSVETHPNCKDPSRDCHHCGKQFPKPFKLQRHLVVHNLERIFLCHKCPVSYQEAQELKEHLKKAHKEAEEFESKHTTLYTCELCADVMHVIKKSFICSTCNYTFSKKEQFDRHMEKHLSGGNKIFKFRGVLRPVTLPAFKENECDSPTSKKRKLLSDSLPENSSDSGIASVSSLHLSQSADTQSSKPSVAMADDSTQTAASQYHNDSNGTSVKTEDAPEDSSGLLADPEEQSQMSSAGSSMPKEEEGDLILPTNVYNKSIEESITESRGVKEEKESVCIRAETTSWVSLKVSSGAEESVVKAKEGDTVDAITDPPAVKDSNSVSSREGQIPSETLDFVNPKLGCDAVADELEQTSINDSKQPKRAASAERDGGNQKRDSVRVAPATDNTSSSVRSSCTKAPETTQASASKSSPNCSGSTEDRESAKQQKKRKEAKLMHNLQRAPPPATQENFGVESRAKKKFRTNKCTNSCLQRKPDGANENPVLASVRDDVVSNKIVSKCKTVNLSVQSRRALLDKRADAAAAQNADSKIKKGVQGRSVHLKGSSVPMNNSLNKSRSKLGVRAVESHSFRTAESQNFLLSQLFGQKLTSFKIPLRKDTSESIN